MGTSLTRGHPDLVFAVDVDLVVDLDLVVVVDLVLDLVLDPAAFGRCFRLH
jgi:hypothetical protein